MYILSNTAAPQTRASASAPRVPPDASSPRRADVHPRPFPAPPYEWSATEWAFLLQNNSVDCTSICTVAIALSLHLPFFLSSFDSFE